MAESGPAPGVLRTPDSAFQALRDYPFAPHYVHVPFAAAESKQKQLRMHYVDEGKSGAGGVTVLLLHGEPTWSYLYRHMIVGLAKAGYRVVAPDLIGFGK
jgi:haloalkane dehalogenase